MSFNRVGTESRKPCPRPLSCTTSRQPTMYLSFFSLFLLDNLSFYQSFSLFKFFLCSLTSFLFFLSLYLSRAVFCLALFIFLLSFCLQYYVTHFERVWKFEQREKLKKNYFKKNNELCIGHFLTGSDFFFTEAK